MALDFTLPPDLRDLVDRVRAYVEEEALPGEAEIADSADLLASWDVVLKLAASGESVRAACGEL